MRVEGSEFRISILRGKVQGFGAGTSGTTGGWRLATHGLDPAVAYLIEALLFRGLGCTIP